MQNLARIWARRVEFIFYCAYAALHHSSWPAAIDGLLSSSDLVNILRSLLKHFMKIALCGEGQRERERKKEWKGCKMKVYTVNNKTIYCANILSARGMGESTGLCGRHEGCCVAVEPISSHFSRLTYENLNLSMQNGSWSPGGWGRRDEISATHTPLSPLPRRAELSACKCVCNGLNMLDSRPLSNMHMHCASVCESVCEWESVTFACFWLCWLFVCADFEWTKWCGAGASAMKN